MVCIINRKEYSIEKNWEFEKAAQLRDEIIDLRKLTNIEKIVTGVD